VFAGAQPAHEPVVDAAEQLLFLIRDADDRELREAVEVVDDAGVFELVDLVEDDDGSRAVMLLEAIATSRLSSTASPTTAWKARSCLSTGTPSGSVSTPATRTRANRSPRTPTFSTRVKTGISRLKTT